MAHAKQCRIPSLVHSAKNLRGCGRAIVSMRGPVQVVQLGRSVSMIRVIKRGACASGYLFLKIKAAAPGNPCSTTKKPRKSAAFSMQLESELLRMAYARPACFMTSAAKSSDCFSMPSPTARRTKLTTSAPAALRAASTVMLVSST